MKIVFLDFDGVLNKVNDYSSDLYLAKDKIDLLDILIEKTGANIIVTSSWKSSYQLDTLKDRFKRAGSKSFDKIIGTTDPHVPGHGLGIQKWLLNHEAVNTYLILDDNDDMFPTQRSHFVRTNQYVGLTLNDVNLALEILK